MSDISTPFLEHSQRFWQERSDRPVSDEDVRQIVANVTGFFHLLATWAAEEDHQEKRPCSALSGGLVAAGAGGQR